MGVVFAVVLSPSPLLAEAEVEPDERLVPDAVVRDFDRDEEEPGLETGLLFVEASGPD